MTRVFIAVDPSEAARRSLANLTNRVALALPGARTVGPETLHVTLAFLGEQDDASVAETIAAARAAAENVTPFLLRLGQVGVFGPERAPRVVWVALDGQVVRLRVLQRRLALALNAREMLWDDSKPFAPHLTLARLKSALDSRAAAELAKLRAEPPRAEPWTVAELRVMRSDLTPNGARYTPLAVIPFN
jgi:2'-5' RNA ligase